MRFPQLCLRTHKTNKNVWPPDHQLGVFFVVSLNKKNDKNRVVGDSLRWRHNGRDCVSNHQPHNCLLNRLFGRRSKKTQKLRVTGLCVGNSLHKWPVTRKMFPFSSSCLDVIKLMWRECKVTSTLDIWDFRQKQLFISNWCLHTFYFTVQNPVLFS